MTVTYQNKQTNRPIDRQTDTDMKWTDRRKRRHTYRHTNRWSCSRVHPVAR